MDAGISGASMPNHAQYKGKLEAYTEGKDPLAMQLDTPRILAELMAGATEQSAPAAAPSE